MSNIKESVKACLLIAMMFVITPVLAEMDHSQHQGMDHSGMQGNKSSVSPAMQMSGGKEQASLKRNPSLSKLLAVPESGKAREGGYDGRYVMESTDVSDNLQIHCAKASRGLVMMDNASWSRCGGKPIGVPVTAHPSNANRPAETMDGHAGHNM